MRIRIAGWSSFQYRSGYRSTASRSAAGGAQAILVCEPAAGRAELMSRGRVETIRLSELKPAEAAPLLKTYRRKYAVVAPFFEAKPGIVAYVFGSVTLRPMIGIRAPYRSTTGASWLLASAGRSVRS